ncbi:hypothetical protein FQR65_LT02068 [Abscondita terminalis]|nr:hypothetical protein FQR65_LT02068 [Abscondita terminalis]
MSNHNEFHNTFRSNATVAKIMKPVTAEFYYQIKNELQNRELKTLYRRACNRPTNVVEKDVLNLTPIKSLEEYNDTKQIASDELSKKCRYFDENFKEIPVKHGRLKKENKNTYVSKNDMESGNVFHWDSMLGKDAFHRTSGHGYFQEKDSKQCFKLFIHKHCTQLFNHCPIRHETLMLVYSLVKNMQLLIKFWECSSILLILFVFDFIVNYSQYTL